MTLRVVLVGRKQLSQRQESSFSHVPLLVQEGLSLVPFRYGLPTVLPSVRVALIIVRTALVKNDARARIPRQSTECTD